MIDITLSTNIVSLSFRAIAAFVILAFVFPLQLREFKVKDGLAKLRKRLLLIGLTVLILDILSMISIFLRITADPKTFLDVSLILGLINGVGYINLAYQGFKIYHEQYLD